MLIGLRQKIADLFLLGLMCGTTLLLWRTDAITGLLPPPLPLAVALAAGIVAGNLPGFARGSLSWIRKGDWGPQQILIIAVVAAISGITLVCWYAVVKPDVSDFAGRVSDVRPVALIALGVLFSVTNAVCEEFLWRGMIFDALERISLPPAAVISIQALSFGMAHLHGFPRGVSGIVLASIYGFILGCVRKQAKGLLTPIAAHVIADLVIFAILASAVLRSSLGDLLSH